MYVLRLVIKVSFYIYILKTFIHVCCLRNTSQKAVLVKSLKKCHELVQVQLHQPQSVINYANFFMGKLFWHSSIVQFHSSALLCKTGLSYLYTLLSMPSSMMHRQQKCFLETNLALKLNYALFELSHEMPSFGMISEIQRGGISNK